MESCTVWPLVTGLFSCTLNRLRFIPVVAGVSTVSLFMAEYYSILWVGHILLIYSSAERRGQIYVSGVPWRLVGEELGVRQGWSQQAMLSRGLTAER